MPQEPGGAPLADHSKGGGAKGLYKDKSWSKNQLGR